MGGFSSPTLSFLPFLKLAVLLYVLGIAWLLVLPSFSVTKGFKPYGRLFLDETALKSRFYAPDMNKLTFLQTSNSQLQHLTEKMNQLAQNQDILTFASSLVEHFDLWQTEQPNPPFSKLSLSLLSAENEEDGFSTDIDTVSHFLVFAQDPQQQTGQEVVDIVHLWSLSESGLHTQDLADLLNLRFRSALYAHEEIPLSRTTRHIFPLSPSSSSSSSHTLLRLLLNPLPKEGASSKLQREALVISYTDSPYITPLQVHSSQGPWQPNLDLVTTAVRSFYDVLPSWPLRREEEGVGQELSSVDSLDRYVCPLLLSPSFPFLREYSIPFCRAVHLNRIGDKTSLDQSFLAAFLRQNIDAVAIQLPVVSSSSDQERLSFLSNKVERGILSFVRSLNQLHEKLHHSYPQYLLTFPPSLSLTPLVRAQDLLFIPFSEYFLVFLVLILPSVLIAFYLLKKASIPSLMLFSFLLLPFLAITITMSLERPFFDVIGLLLVATPPLLLLSSLA